MPISRTNASAMNCGLNKREVDIRSAACGDVEGLTIVSKFQSCEAPPSPPAPDHHQRHIFKLVDTACRRQSHSLAALPVRSHEGTKAFQP